MRIFVAKHFAFWSKKYSLEVEPTDRLADIKLKFQEIEGIPVDQQYGFIILGHGFCKDDNKTLQDYSIHDDDTIFVVLPRLRGGI